MKAFDPSRRAAARDGPKQARPAAAEPIDDAGDQRALGPDDGEPDILANRELQQGVDVVGRNVDIAHLGLECRARVPRSDEYLLDPRRLRALPRQCVFAAAAADDQNLHETMDAASPGRERVCAVTMGRSVFKSALLNDESGAFR